MTAPRKSLWPVLLGALVLLLLFGGGARLLSLWTPPREDAVRSQERLKAYAELQAENAKKLETYAWIDRDKGLVQIPVERAIALTIPELNARPPGPAGPIATPTPAPAASPSP